MLESYVPIALTIAVALALAGAFTMLAKFFGPRKPSAEKAAPFECGSEPVGSPRVRFSVKFYVVAILFLVFDLETALLYPWAVQYRSLTHNVDGTISVAPFVELLVFVGVLAVAWTYVWRKKAVGWE